MSGETSNLAPRSSLLAPQTLVVGQSGGATAVINASLVGVIEGARASSRFDRILGMRYGIEGLLSEQFIDLGRQPASTIARVRHTPSAALGTGRHKLHDDDLDQALTILKRHNARAFIYIGGNDSADTAHRLHTHALAGDDELAIVSVPKTIDNDLPETDHCPGYGSIARFLANAVRDATYDTIASPQLYPVKFIEVMGRDAGWVPAACALGFDADEFDLTPLIYMPERPPATTDDLLSDIEARLSERGWVVAVVPETLRDAAGRHFGGDQPEHVDSFGHPYFASPGEALSRLVRQRLGRRARFDKPGTIARMSIALASAVDLDEAYRLGWAAAQRAAAGESDLMTALRRVADNPYACEVTAVPLNAVANRARPLPDAFIDSDDRAISAAFRRYALPLLGPNPLPPYGRFIP